MSDPYDGQGYLAVERSVNGATNSLVEVWVLRSLAWSEDNIEDYRMVDLHICHAEEARRNSIPSTSVVETCDWDDVPSDVKAQFTAQLDRIQQALTTDTDE